MTLTLESSALAYALQRYDSSGFRGRAMHCRCFALSNLSVHTQLLLALACYICMPFEHDSQEADLQPAMLPCGHTICTGCLGTCKPTNIVSKATCTQYVQVDALCLGNFCGCWPLRTTPQRVEDLYPQDVLARARVRSTIALEDPRQETLQVAVLPLNITVGVAKLCQRRKLCCRLSKSRCHTNMHGSSRSGIPR